MKYIIILAVASVAAAAKLEKVYLPPNADSAGGADAGLQTPFGPSDDFEAQKLGNQAQGVSKQPQGLINQAQVYANKPQGFENKPQDFSNQLQGFGNQLQELDNKPQGFNNQPQGFDNQPQQLISQPQAQVFSQPQISGNPGFSQAQSNGNQAEILKFENVMTEEGYHYAYETSDGTKAQQDGQIVPGVKPEEGSLRVSGSYSYMGDDGQIYTVSYIADENGFQPVGDHLPTPPPIPEAILKSLQLTDREGKYSSQKSSYDADAGY